MSISVSNDNLAELYSRLDDSLTEDKAGSREEAYKTLKNLSAEHQTEPEFLWRMAKVCFLYSKLFPNDKKQRRLICTEARDCALAAEKLEPQNADIQKWCAVAVGNMRDFVSVSEKIQGGYKFKEYIDRALELRPDDATIHHLRARWCYNIADMNPVERKAAKTLFTDPPRATFEEALAGFLEVEKLLPNQWIQNLLHVAKSYIKLKKTPLALPYLETVRILDPITVEDKMFKAEAMQIFAKKFKQKQ